MSRFLTIAMASVLFFSAPAVENKTDASPKIKTEKGSLYERVEQMSGKLFAKDSEKFRPPTPGQQKAWNAIVGSILKNRPDDARQIIEKLSFPYEVILFTDQTTKQNYVLLQETMPPQAGWGFYAFNLETKNPLTIEVTHPVADARTEFEGIDAFLQTGAQAFLMAGAHRRANKKDTPCTQPGSADDDATYPESDVAHNAATIFQTTHETLVTMNAATVAVQLHGMIERPICPNVFMSSGTKTVTSNSKQLFSCMTKMKVEAGVYEGNRDGCPLGATTNVQGRFSNNEKRDPCNTSVKVAPEPGYFIHIEQEPSVRRNKESWQPVIEALKCAFP
jgi:hypothetical protein